jgi:hypothetical protein
MLQDKAAAAAAAAVARAAEVREKHLAAPKVPGRNATSERSSVGTEDTGSAAAEAEMVADMSAVMEEVVPVTCCAGLLVQAPVQVRPRVGRPGHRSAEAGNRDSAAAELPEGTL